MMKRPVVVRPLVLLAMISCCASWVSAQAVMQELTREDAVYRQHQELVAAYHRSAAQQEATPPLIFFGYAPSPEDDLFSIAARLMLPYATLVTANRLDSLEPLPQRLLIPSVPGLVSYDRPATSLEAMITERLGDSGIPIAVPGVTNSAEGTASSAPGAASSAPNAASSAPDAASSAPGAAHSTPSAASSAPDAASGTIYRGRFHIGADFSQTERSHFLRVTFVDPVPSGVVSSRYGYRNHPVTGVWSFHRGIDLAADYGTPIRAASDGVVTAIERDGWLGLSVTIDHRGGYRTVYAHLQESRVATGEEIMQGATVGFVGSSGLSTGPHLHFEIIRNGEPRNPELYIRRRGQ